MDKQSQDQGRTSSMPSSIARDLDYPEDRARSHSRPALPLSRDLEYADDRATRQSRPALSLAEIVGDQIARSLQQLPQDPVSQQQLGLQRPRDNRNLERRDARGAHRAMERQNKMFDELKSKFEGLAKEAKDSLQNIAEKVNMQTGNPATIAPSHNLEDLKLAKLLATQGRDEKARAISDYILNPTKNTFYGRSFEDVSDKFFTDHPDQDLLTAMQGLENVIEPKDYSSSQLGLTLDQRNAYRALHNQAVNDVVLAKTGWLATGQNMEKLYEHLKERYRNDPIAMAQLRNVTNRQLKDLVLLDDWKDIAKKAVPLIIQHGPKAVDWLWNKFATKLKSWTLPKHDAGLTIDDYHNNPFIGSKFSEIPEISVSRKDVPPLKVKGLKRDGVNSDYLATVICPERFAHRQPVIFPEKTGIIASSTEIVLTSDTNGNTALVLAPYNVAFSNTTSTTAFFAAYNPTVFDPVNGTYTAITTVNGPLSAGAANIQRYKLVGMSYVVTPLMSQLNAGGSVQCAYFTSASATSGNLFPQLSVCANQFYQSGNVMTTYRGINLPDANEVYYTPNGSAGAVTNTDLHYILFTGCPANTKVAKVDIYYVVELIPTPSQAQFTIQQLPDPGPDTLYALNGVYNLLQAIQMLTVDDALALGNNLKMTDNYYDVLITVEKWMTGYKPRVNGPVMPVERGVAGSDFEFD